MNNDEMLQTPYVLEMENISRSFVQGNEIIDVLDQADLSIKQGEMVALVGPSGSGKSTLLQLAGLLERSNGGEVVIDGIATSEGGDNERTMLRRDKIGFVYQSHRLMPDFTAVENLMLPQLIAGHKRRDARERGLSLLKQVGLAHRAEHLPSELSGGEQQRVAIARALVNAPVLLLADEPTGNLDPKTADDVFSLFIHAVKGMQVGALIATHDMELAQKMDRVVTLKDGQVVDFQIGD